VPDLKIINSINPHIWLAHSKKITVIQIFLNQYYSYTEIPGQQVPKHGVERLTRDELLF